MRENAGMATEITCSTCKACCCRLEVILMGDDDPPDRFVETDRWGGQVMKRLEDGLCAALDRQTHLCTIYTRRPGVCREFAMGGDDCLAERKGFSIAVMPHQD
jgi:Fe-S-cluster containining protein